MFNIIYSSNSLKSLISFIDSYKSSYIRLIKDSGLDVEDLLIKNYIDLGNNLYKNVVDKIEDAISKEIILGRNLNEKYIILTVNNFRIFIYYGEDLNKKERIIEKIEFFRK
ncbi:MAG: hypothetical protein PHZ26_03480 [Candidatus Gracilibacteria bacterium]|nr:hypothetical protein [Candidatus Gracilibacteria bacterium]MDD2908788.1 hypothetical protein [Candidatus Gracilibacteria bacterium]